MKQDKKIKIKMAKNKKIGELVAIIILLSIFSIYFVSADVTWSDDQGNPFTYGGAVVCQSDATSAIWNNGITTVDAMSDCYRVDGISSSGTSQTSCCKTGYQCGGTTEEPKSSCIPIERNVISCNTYSQSECEARGTGILPQGIQDHIENDIVTTNTEGLHFCNPNADGSEHLISNQCDYYSNCRCEWRIVGGAGRCEEKFDITDICAPEDNPNIVTCRTTTYNLVDKCSVDQVFVLNWTSRLIDNAGAILPPIETTPDQRENCRSGQKTFPCPESSNLPFFGFFNLIISGLMIIGIYLFLRRK